MTENNAAQSVLTDETIRAIAAYHEGNGDSMLAFARAIEAAVLKLRAPVADESPMAKIAGALREKARQEQQAYQVRRDQANEWGPMSEGTEADDPSGLAALADGLESIKGNENAAMAAMYIRAQADRLASAVGDITARPVARVAGDDSSRYIEWDKERSAWEMPVGTPLFYSKRCPSGADDHRIGWVDDGAKVFWENGAPADGTDLYANASASAPVAGEAKPVGYFQPGREVAGTGILKGFITVDDFGGDKAAMTDWAKDSGATPLYAAPQASEAHSYARNLAVTMWEKRFKQDAPEWKPCEDLIGVLTQIDNMTAGLVVPQASEAVRSEQDATGRTPTDYALEFAEYLARDAEYAMACLNASQRANEALLDLTEEVASSDAYQAAEEAAAEADEAFTEAITGLRSAAFEFRKRRDRAALSAQPGAQKDGNP
ncbi:hypothetical protein [Achromobacter xylosoxidans]|uniref:hypothetical protein n=1 Tax=Alcaligenes xylosoxydans xylosoxydans TaxID=85698 RepID=UPI000B492910|nr:hypothetical protein [Achromobacter xylosoxidans]